MVFSSVPFLFYFLPALLAFYYVIPARFRSARNTVLLIASLIFYAWGEGYYIVVLLVSIALNHYLGKSISNSLNCKIPLVIGIVLNLVILSYYKYAGFISSVFGADEWNTPKLPLGISFFTFQAISYLIDVARKDAPTTRSLGDTALYICSFPQLIAGPIVRYKDIALQIFERTESIAKISLGIKIFILGLAQKVLIANVLGEVADQAFELPVATLSAAEAWYGLTAYSLQIFFDFAGYSTMAIGLGYMLGFKFPQNFRAPYSSSSVTEFWRRWHITLSSWFRDYLYIPLGGNRVALWRQITNLWIVFLLCGLWHGADWVFILWGIWHGFFLSLERLGLSRLLAAAWRPIKHAYTLLIVFLGWVLFRADSVEHAIDYYRALFGLSAGTGDTNLLIIKTKIIVFMLVAFCLSTQRVQNAISEMFNLTKSDTGLRQGSEFIPKIASMTAVYALFLASVFALASNAYNPFIYFRF